MYGGIERYQGRGTEQRSSWRIIDAKTLMSEGGLSISSSHRRAVVAATHIRA